MAKRTVSESQSGQQPEEIKKALLAAHNRNLSKFPTAAREKPESKAALFFLRVDPDHPGMDPDPRPHLGLAADHFKNQIANLETVEGLASIDEENSTIRAMSFGIVAVLENLREVHQHFSEVIDLIEPASAKKGGEA